MCVPCARRHHTERQQAQAQVRKAVKSGAIPAATSLTCTDCGKPAEGYDHRDYTRPLDVEPVCHHCNFARGPAFNSLWRPEVAPA